MSVILHHKDLSNITKPERYDVPAGTNLLDWMCKQWQNDYEMAGGLESSVIVNGCEIFKSNDDDFSESALDFDIGENDTVSIVNRPAYEGVVYLVVILVAVAVSLALAPALPGEAGERSESPNNRLNAASNSFRPGEATPEIFGSIVSYPDFVQPSYFEYINNLRIVSELGYIGEGRYQTGEVRNGETPFSNIPGSSATIYQPGATIPPELLTIHRPAEPVDGQSLLATNDESLIQPNQVESEGLSTGGNVTLTLIADSTLAFDLALAVGETVAVGNLRIDPDGSLGGTVNNLVVLALETNAQNRTVITFDTTTPTGLQPEVLTIAKTDGDGFIGNRIGYFDIPGTDTLEVWFNWQMPQGIRNEEGNRISITIEFEIELLNDSGQPTGTTFTQEEVITGATLDAQFRTTKFTPVDFPSMIRAQYRGRVRRLTTRFEAGSSEQIRLEQMVSVTPYTNFDNSTGTVIAFERRATNFATSRSGNRNNLDVTRMLPTYNRATNTYDVNTLTATRSFADAAAYTLIVAAGRSAANVDLAELYEINDGLPHDELGYFDFSFDNKNVGLGERIESICNAARVFPFRDGAIWRFTRDEAKPFRTAMFNRRSTTSNNSVQSYLLQRPDDKDSVALTYVDPELNVERILYRRVDSNGNIVSDGQGRQPLEIKLAGCRNFFQAVNRIELEIRRIIYQRLTVRDNVHKDGLVVGLLDRVGWVDPNDMDLFSGEIVGFNGNVFDTSERFEPLDGVSYFVYITNDEGHSSNTVPVAARTNTEFGFIASGLSGAYLASNDGAQLGSKYFIASESEIAAGDFQLTTRRPQSDNTVDIELVEYVPEMYARDADNPPQSPVVMPQEVMSSGFSSSPSDAVAEISVNSNGTITTSNGLSFDYIENPSAGIGSNFEVMLTQSSGDAIAGESLGEWLSISTNRTWTVTRVNDGAGSNTGFGVLSVRDSSFSENIGSSNVEIQASVSGAPSLPASISVLNTDSPPSTASISLLSNGLYRTSGLESGSYTEEATGIGSLFEAMASVTSGDTQDVLGNNLDEWIGLGGSTVSWMVVAESSTDDISATINVQIRSISNNASLTSSSVTLRAQGTLTP